MLADPGTADGAGDDARGAMAVQPPAVEGQQGDQGMLGWRTEPGGDQDGAELVAVESSGVRLVVQPGPPDVRGRGVLEQLAAPALTAGSLRRRDGRR
jgi:hypothetical protein